MPKNGVHTDVFSSYDNLSRRIKGAFSLLEPGLQSPAAGIVQRVVAKSEGDIGGTMGTTVEDPIPSFGQSQGTCSYKQ